MIQREKFDECVDGVLRASCALGDEQGRRFSAELTADCFAALEVITTNLFLQPWRLAEFARITVPSFTKTNQYGCS